MKRPPVRIRTFLLATFVLVLLLPALAGGAAWLIERRHQSVERRQGLNTAFAYLTSHRGTIRQPATIEGFAHLLDRLGLLSQLVVITSSPPAKTQIYLSPSLNPTVQKQLAAGAKKPGRPGGAAAQPADPAASLPETQRLIAIGTRNAPALLAAGLFHRAPSRATEALVALVSGLVVLVAALAVAVWLAGRWMAAPLARLSAQVDKVAGGDLAIAVPRSRIGEIANIAQAVEGMTAALGATSHQRAEAEEARRFLVTSIAHDLRTPLFALRGHLQALGSRLGDPNVHLERAEARADALERLIGNLFAYTRDDYTQSTLRLEAVPVAGLLEEVAAGLEHAARVGGNTFELSGDRDLEVVVDRDRVKRALTNILDNALRHSPPGAAVELSWAAVDGSSVEIAIRDRGPGIDPDLLPHIFDPGVRATTADGTSGAGLGLTIAKRLLDDHHAPLTACSRPDGGAEFRFTISRTP